MNKPFYITTPIYYVNDVPHIGHTLTTVAADIVARAHKLRGESVFLLTGTDEHGTKVAEAAAKENLSPQEYADKLAKQFAEAWLKLNIAYDYFIRTTHPQHKKIAQDFLTRLRDRGEIYKDWYEGLYCVGCEKFLTEDDIHGGVCPLHPNRKPVHQREENYFFRLSKYQQRLIDAITEPKNPHHYSVNPTSKRNEVLSKLKAGIQDLSISRQTVAWGIPIPWDQKQTTYVWVEALINYYSAPQIVKQNLWPATIHLVGKEILWFHSVIWPAMLLAAGYPLPTQIFAHSFYVIDGQKMSKSLGNVISPHDLRRKYGADATRYLLARSFPYEDDSDVGWTFFTERYNADLANGWGNLVQRVATLAHAAKISVHHSKKNRELHKEYHELMDTFRFHDILDHVWKRMREVDRLIDEKKPWELLKRDPQRAKRVLVDCTLRTLHINEHLKPFLPETSAAVEKRLTAKPVAFGPPFFPRRQP